MEPALPLPVSRAPQSQRFRSLVGRNRWPGWNVGRYYQLEVNGLAFAKSNTRKGFTLVELLVATLILAMVITAAGAMLAAGIRTWQTARDHLQLEAGGLPGLILWERDLMNAEPFFAGADARAREGAFQGTSDSVTIPLTVSAPGDRNESAPGYARYRFDPRKRAVLRESWLLDETPPEGSELLIRNVDALTIRYLCPVALAERRSADQGQVSWDDPVNLPAGVVLTLELSASGAPDQTWRRTIVLPRARRNRGIGD